MSGYYPEGAAFDSRNPDDDGLDEFEPDPDAEFERLRDERIFDAADDYRKYGRGGL